MSEEKKLASLADLQEARDASSTIVTLPGASAKAGREINVRVRAIEPIDFVKAINFPADEINAIIHGRSTQEDYEASVEEHSKTLGYDELLVAGARIVEVGVVEPKIPAGEAQKQLSDSDIMVVFNAIQSLTMPVDVAEAAATFRDDG